MANHSDEEGDKNATIDAHLELLASEVEDLYQYRDLFFENHPLEMASEKSKLIEEKMNELIEKFNEIEETSISPASRAQYLYLKGRTYNVGVVHNPKATQCLNKAVKLNPRLVEAWNELGESYWKSSNVKDAKNSFEGALKQERNRITLRSLSIIVRQESANNNGTPADWKQIFDKSIELAKEAVAQDPKDGVSWSILGNAHLCRYFLVNQDPATLKASMSAYKQAELDPIARGLPDLYYNNAVALKYDEQYMESMKRFEKVCKLDPDWEVPMLEKKKFEDYLFKVNELIRTKGKIKTKKLQQMIQSIDNKMTGQYTASGKLTLMPLSQLHIGENPKTIVLGKVVGSVYMESLVPFTFAIIDHSMQCLSVTVYNWADGRGVIIGDTVAIPQPLLSEHNLSIHDKEYSFMSIRVNNPLKLLVNGKKVGRNQFAGTKVTSTYEIH